AATCAKRSTDAREGHEARASRTALRFHRTASQRSFAAVTASEMRDRARQPSDSQVDVTRRTIMAVDKHRVALVTGGMGGLGEAICVKLAALGYTVVTTHSPGNTKAAEWLDSMKKHGQNFHAYPCDVA